MGRELYITAESSSFIKNINIYMIFGFRLLLSYYRNNDLDTDHFLRIKINDCLCIRLSSTLSQSLIPRKSCAIFASA